MNMSILDDRFHTIKSILNQSMLIRVAFNELSFHTIKSILN